MDINDKTAVVTGSSRGLGTAISRELVKDGAQVYGLARSLDKLNALQDELGNDFTPSRLDITDPQAIEQWVNSNFSGDDRPDILINNAGSSHFGKVDEMNSESWQSMIDTNINGIFNITSRIVPLMKENEGSSHIINIGSILGGQGNPKMSGYCATKFAVRGFSESLFKELRYDNIKVTCVNPGSIETNLFKEDGVEPHGNMLQPSGIAGTVTDVLNTPDNMLISDLTMRPLNPKNPS